MGERGVLARRRRPRSRVARLAARHQALDLAGQAGLDRAARRHFRHAGGHGLAAAQRDLVEHQLLDGQRLPLDRRPVEQAAQRHRDAEGSFQPVQHLRDEQGVAAQLEEVVVDADPVEPQHLGPDRRHGLLDPGARGEVAGGHLRAEALRRGQRAAVDLAARGERHRLELDEGGRQHVVRQPPRQPGAQLARRRALAVGAHPVGGQAVAAGAFLARHHRRLRHRRVRRQRRFDLRRLDAEAADLELLVGAAEELELARRQPAREVAGAVHPLARQRAEGVGQEALRGGAGPAEVAARDSRAGHEELAGEARGREPSPRVEHVGAHAPHRPADRHFAGRRRGGRQLGAGRHDGRLGGAVGIDQAHPLAGPALPRAQRLGQGALAADEQ